MHAVGAAGWFFFGDGSCRALSSREYDADCTVKHLDCGGIYTKLYVTKSPRTTYSHPSGSTSYGAIWKALDGGNIRVLISILYYSCKSCAVARGRCCRRRGEGSRDLFVHICVLSYESVITSKYKAKTSKPLSQKILISKSEGNLAISVFKSILYNSVA